MQVVMTVVGGVHNGRKIAISVPVFLIGRDAACHLRPASQEISRQHCAIVIRGDRAFLRDYGSRNGTTLNHRVLMHGELQLEDNDLIEVGPLVFRVTLCAELTTPPEGTTEESPGAAPDTAIQIINGDGEPGPDDTVLVPREHLASAKKAMKDSPEVLCPE